MKQRVKNISDVFLYFFMVVFLFVASGCTAEEPPQNFGQSKPGDLVRSTKLISMDSEAKTMKYEINYPALNLTSIAIVGFRTGVLRQEIFEKKWKIDYIYKKFAEPYGIPSSIIVYAYSRDTDTYSKKINEYTHESTKPNRLFYRDKNGKIVERDPFYFMIGDGPSIGGRPF